MVEGVLVFVGVIDTVGEGVGVKEVEGDGEGNIGIVGTNPMPPLITRESLECTLKIGGIKIIYYSCKILSGNIINNNER